MSTISQAIKSNEDYRAGQSEIRKLPNPVIFKSGPMPLVQLPMNFPVRGVFPPDLIIGTDFFSGARQFRSNMRSSSAIPPTSVSKQNTPQFLLNKKLVSPIIGGGSIFRRYNSIVASVTPISVAANTTVSQSFTVAGVSAADKLIGQQWTLPQTSGVVVVAIRVSGNNKIEIDFSNQTAGPLVPTGGEITLVLVQ